MGWKEPNLRITKDYSRKEVLDKIWTAVELSLSPQTYSELLDKVGCFIRDNLIEKNKRDERKWE